MSVWFSVWAALAPLLACAWLVRYARIRRILRERCILSSRSCNGALPNPPRVSIIVAAKDEESVIETCVNGLLGQDYPDFELIAVDDRSEDQTPCILRRLRERRPERLKVVTVTTLRDGWAGKNNAMREGVAASEGQWLLFTDADCCQTSSKTLSVAMHEAIDHDCDILSITPVLRACTIWEHIIQPVCIVALMIWFQPHRVNRPWRSTAYANGAFMLVRRNCYETIGGHEHVRAEVNEDVHMARRAKQLGMRLRVVENDDLYYTRMYDSLAAAWRGWSRIFYGCLGSLWRLSVSAALIAVLGIIPWVSMITALGGLLTAGPTPATAWALAAAAWAAVVVLAQFVVWRECAAWKLGRFWSFAHVLGAILTLGILVNAMLKTIGITGTTWRGTTYSRGYRNRRTTAYNLRDKVRCLADCGDET